jgi:hypothetical protein
METPVAKKLKIDLKLCFLCEGEKKGCLVQKPNYSSVKLLYDAIKELASYGNQKYYRVYSRLNVDSVETFSSLGVTWHLSCYKNATNLKMKETAKKAYQKRLNKSDTIDDCQRALTSPFTRSSSTPHKKEICFFCDGTSLNENKLFRIEKDTRIDQFKTAVRLCKNEKWRVKLSTAVDLQDVSSIDVCCHNECWLRNVHNVLRSNPAIQTIQNPREAEIAAEIEFESVIQFHREIGSILNTSNVQSMYENIRKEFNIPNPEASRKVIKTFLESKFPDIQFHTPSQINKPQRISFKEIRDEAVEHLEDENRIPREVKIIFEAASVLRKSILNTSKWTFRGKFDDVTSENIPENVCMSRGNGSVCRVAPSLIKMAVNFYIITKSRRIQRWHDPQVQGPPGLGCMGRMVPGSY